MPIEKGNLIVKIVKSQYFGKMLLMLSCNHFFICLLFLFYEINSFKKWDTPLWISGDGWVRKSFSSGASNSNHTKNSYPFPTPPPSRPHPQILSKINNIKKLHWSILSSNWTTQNWVFFYHIYLPLAMQVEHTSPQFSFHELTKLNFTELNCMNMNLAHTFWVRKGQSVFRKLEHMQYRKNTRARPAGPASIPWNSWGRYSSCPCRILWNRA